MKNRKEIFDLPSEVRGEMALKSAVEKLVRKSRETGQCLFVWKDGKVLSLDPFRAGLVAEERVEYGKEQF